MNFGVHMRGRQKWNPDEFGDVLIFYQAVSFCPLESKRKNLC